MTQLSYLSKYFCPNQSQYFYQNFSKHWSQDMLDRHMMLGHKPSKHFRRSISSKPSKQTKPSQPSILKCLQRSRQNYELWELVYWETVWRIFSVAKVTLQSQMSVSLSVCHQNPPTASSFIIHASSIVLHFATYKLFSLFLPFIFIHCSIFDTEDNKVCPS